MLLLLPGVVTRENVTKIAAALGTAEFVDGRLTSSDASTTGKHNLQLPRGGAHAEAVGELVLRSLLSHADFTRAAHPRFVLRPQIARYDAGMHYARHLDSAFMADGQRIRADLSVTVFLSDAASYDGGDLVLETEAGERRMRGDAGDVLLYPSTYVHEVTPITRGTRLVAVTWIESLVRGAAERKILHDLACSVTALEASTSSDAHAILTLRQCHENLLRMWAG